VALSELHEGVLQDLLTNRLGYGWDERTRAHSRVPRWDIAGVPDALIHDFSRRSSDIETAMNGLVTDFATAHGRQPSRVEMLRLREQATLQTRPDKQQHTLLEQTEQWRTRAQPHLPDTPNAPDEAGGAWWSDGLRDRGVLPPLHAATIDAAMLEEVAAVALHTVGSKRATFSPANVLAEVHRQLHGARFATPADRLTVADSTTGLALDQAVLLTPSDRPGGARIYTTRQILDAESRLLDAARDTGGPALPPDEVRETLATDRGADGAAQPALSDEQAAAVHAIASSGRTLDLLVGPAGAGKTTTLTALRTAWQDGYGPGSVIGLAPSAAAAQVLADQLGIPTDNTAKWLHETARQDERLDRMTALINRIEASTSSPSTARGRQFYTQLGEVYSDYERWMIRPGQLLIIDEASLAGTLALDQIVAHARDADAKVLLVGDWAQLGAIEAGGAFAMLTADRPDTPELNEVHRFAHQWERDATTKLRVGDPAVIDTYAAQDRIRSGDRDTMLDSVYSAWREDVDRGLESVMIAADRDSVAELNQRAQTDRIVAGEVSEAQVPIADGTAGVGDSVVTRRNDRTLRTPGGWVLNGDTWTITGLRGDGSMTVRNDAVEVVIPQQYVRNHVELRYATTAYRVQGRTVDTAHALITASDTREVLYVAATRGRVSNTLYIDSEGGGDDETNHEPATDRAAHDVLQKVLDRSGADTSAHATYEQEAELVLAFEAERSRAASRRPSFREPWTPLAESPTTQNRITS
ncbi:MAG: AAA family ATPase, partial [Jatrophihabitantaceae bacterium]